MTPIPELISFFGTAFVMCCVIGIISFIVWFDARKYPSKCDWLSDVKSRYEEYEQQFKSTTYSMIIYLLAIPILVLIVVGAQVVVDNNPAWKLPLMIMIVIVNVFSLWWGVVMPLVTLIYRISVIGAITINAYVRDTYPLRYYESKYGDEHSTFPEKIRYDWMLEEPKPKQP